MAKLKNHPNSWLRDDAAAAFDKAEDDHGVFVVNSAGRTEAHQQKLIDRWNKGGPSNRPPYLYQPAIPASSSNHVKDGGMAIDIGDWKRFAKIAAKYGFSHPYPGGDPVHFEFVGLPKTAPKVSKVTKARQIFLNARGWDLVEDGIEGPLTQKAYKEYQTYLRKRGWYKGKIDGKWGPLTQAGHNKHKAELNNKYHVGTVKDLETLPETRGLQKLAKLYGYAGPLDNEFGSGSQAGLQNFLNKNYRGSLARWLRTRWGYEDVDDYWGPNMRAALKRANKANWEELK